MQKTKTSANETKKLKKLNLILNRLYNIERILTNMISLVNENRYDEIKAIKWKFAAFVIDRLFFYLSLLYFFFTFFPLIFTAPNFFRPH